MQATGDDADAGIRQVTDLPRRRAWPGPGSPVRRRTSPARTAGPCLRAEATTSAGARRDRCRRCAETARPTLRVRSGPCPGRRRWRRRPRGRRRRRDRCTGPGRPRARSRPPRAPRRRRACPVAGCAAAAPALSAVPICSQDRRPQQRRRPARIVSFRLRPGDGRTAARAGTPLTVLLTSHFGGVTVLLILDSQVRSRPNDAVFALNLRTCLIIASSRW